MEDAVSETLLEDAPAVSFAEIESALGRDAARRNEAAPARALTATVVAVGPPNRLKEVVAPLHHLGNSGAIRGILIPQGTGTGSGARVASNLVVLNGLQDSFIDNAVAALRLSSLPTMIWWRGGPTEVLANLVKLADRVVLDADPPEPTWKCAIEHLDGAPFSDIRWTRLTRWRALMAQFFDLPEVQQAASTIRHLCISGSDRHSAALFAAWMKAMLEWGDNVDTEIQSSGQQAPIASVSVTGRNLALHLRLAKSRTCVESATEIGQGGTSRVVSLGDESLTALLTEELRIRSRDRVFEDALAGVLSS
jgi:glucose-6-phosphate dehydrogenase assembly protein OpcA